MHLDQALDQGQPQPQPSLAAVERLVGLHEGLKQMRDRVRCHAHAVVDHANHPLPCLDRDRDMRPPSAGGELGCVVQEIPDHLCDPGCVGIDHHRGRRQLA